MDETTEEKRFDCVPIVTEPASSKVETKYLYLSSSSLIFNGIVLV